MCVVCVYRCCTALLCVCVCVFVHPHIFGVQQVFAALIAVGVSRHLRVDTGVVSAGQDGHWHTGVDGAFELVGDLSDLFVCAGPEEDLRHLLSAIFVFVLVLRGLFVFG